MPTAFCRSLRIQFNDLSRGSPAFLCLPGWCENKSAFGRITHSLGRSRRVIALDWRGHGKSASPGRVRPRAGRGRALSDPRASVGPIVPVAISHAGWVALDCASASASASRLVFLDWIVGPPPPFLAVLAALR